MADPSRLANKRALCITLICLIDYPFLPHRKAKSTSNARSCKWTHSKVLAIADSDPASKMNSELNNDSILALDGQIAEGAADFIQLKRARNSLLNVMRIPPEILGRIFRFAIIVKKKHPDFPGIQKGSYNFFLVCYHWNQVARGTPELWYSWGNNLEDWKRSCSRPGIIALDLVLDSGFKHGDDTSSFDETLQAALRDHASRDVIRKVHLRSANLELIVSIISSLTPENEVVRQSSMESIILLNVNASNFFARQHFPKLRNLTLTGCQNPPLVHLASHTTALVNLTLSDNANTLTSTFTTSQVVSLLAANPSIRTLDLRLRVIHEDRKRGPRDTVPLRHLEKLSLEGKADRIFSILYQLELPTTMDQTSLTLSDCTLEDIRQVIGPYFSNYLHRDPRFGDRLGLSFNFTLDSVWVSVNALGVGYHTPDLVTLLCPPQVWLSMSLSQNTPPEGRRRMFTDVLPTLPKERIVYFETETLEFEEILVTMPNIEFLHLIRAGVSNGFLQSKNEKLLPSLRRLYLQDAVAANDDWEPLVHYITDQTSGGQSVSLNVFGDSGEVHICSWAVKQLQGLVEELIYLPDPDYECPNFGCENEE